MTSKLARLLAMAAAFLALACVVAWLFDGAPNVPDVDFFKGTSADPYIGQQRFTIISSIIWMLPTAHRWQSYLTILIAAAVVTTAAGLSLFALLRGGSSTAIRYLGVGLGAWSLSICYLFFFTVVTTFDWFISLDKYVRVGFDVTALEILLVSTYAFIRFWQNFPRPVSREELAGFLEQEARAQSALWDALRRVLNAIFSPLRRIPRPVWRVVAIVATFLAGLGLRVSVFPGDEFFGWTFIGLPIVLFLPGLRCLRLFRFHRALGSDEDRRKIEWIWAAMWGWLVLSLLPAVVMPLWILAERWFPELAFEHGLVGTYILFVWLFAPLVFLAALAMSILYRGSVDPQLALRGFTVWTVMGVVLTLVFVFIERSVAFRIAQLMHLPQQTSFVAAGAIVAATFQPIRRYTERNVNRFVERVLPATLLASGKRATAAVGVVDISGYSALSARDEQAALVASALVQKEARRLSDRHGGRVVKSTGDGVILCFEGADAALATVRELHRAVAAGAAALNVPELKLHSGLNWGEVVEMHDGDIYGQTVNITARIAGWAQAGQIGLSGAFRTALSAAPPGLESAGPQAFKNVPTPVECYRLTDA